LADRRHPHRPLLSLPEANGPLPRGGVAWRRGGAPSGREAPCRRETRGAVQARDARRRADAGREAPGERADFSLGGIAELGAAAHQDIAALPLLWSGAMRWLRWGGALGARWWTLSMLRRRHTWRARSRLARGGGAGRAAVWLEDGDMVACRGRVPGQGLARVVHACEARRQHLD